MADPRARVFVSAATGREISIERALGKLKAPFDRTLVAQARFERLAPVTADEAIRAYAVECVDPTR